MVENGKPETVLFLVGPTAVGKSKIGMKLAKRLNGEIISADSMQVYRGMNIGTAKPSQAELKKIPHHLIDIQLPSRLFSVYQFRKFALKKIKEIASRHKLPIVVGGTGFYVRALLEGLSAQPGADFKLRRHLQKEAEDKGSEFLYQRLIKTNPAAAGKINPRDTKRIIRALEIHAQSDKNISMHQGEKKSLMDLGYQPVVIGITKDRPALYADIEQRVDSMFRKGLIQEVKSLCRQRISKTAAQAVGYKEIRQAIKESEKSPGGLRQSLEQARLLIKRNTRRFAKRQMTWFKREKGIQWVMWGKEDSVETMCAKILKQIEN